MKNFMRPINIFFGLCAISVVFFVIFLFIRNHQSREIELLTSPSNYIGVFAVTTSGEIAGASTASLILKAKNSNIILFQQRVGYSFDSLTDAEQELKGWSLNFNASTGQLTLSKGVRRIELHFTTAENSDLRFSEKQPL